MLFNKIIKTKFIAICDQKIAKKGENVGISFYVFFENKNKYPDLLMAVATWWIQLHRLDHFEKALKIKSLLMEDVLRENL